MVSGSPLPSLTTSTPRARLSLCASVVPSSLLCAEPRGPSAERGVRCSVFAGIRGWAGVAGTCRSFRGAWEGPLPPPFPASSSRLCSLFSTPVSASSLILGLDFLLCLHCFLFLLFSAPPSPHSPGHPSPALAPSTWKSGEAARGRRAPGKRGRCQR